MDILKPILFMLVVIIIGFLNKVYKINDIKKRYDFTVDYHNKFKEHVNTLLKGKPFNTQLFYELTLKVNDMQSELGDDGVYEYYQDNLYGIHERNHQILLNYLPETHNIPNGKDDYSARERHITSINNCDYMFVRHIGTLNSTGAALKKNLWNPISNFADGVMSCISFLFILLMMLGVFSKGKTQSIRNSRGMIFIKNVLTILLFISTVWSIFRDWPEFWNSLNTLLSF